MRKFKVLAMLSLAFIIFNVVSPLRASAEECEAYADIQYNEDELAVDALSEDVQVSSRLWELFFGENNNKKAITLCPGGDVFGVKIKQNGSSPPGECQSGAGPAIPF